MTKKFTNPLGQKNPQTNPNKKNHQTSRDNKKSPNLLGKKKHPTSQDPKKSLNLSGKKNYPTFRDKTEITQPIETKK